MPFAIHDRAPRQRLEARSKPNFERPSDGVCIGYRKGKRVSRWVVSVRRWMVRTSCVRSLASFPMTSWKPTVRVFSAFNRR